MSEKREEAIELDKQPQKTPSRDALEKLESLGDPKLDPFEIEFLPQFEKGRDPKGAFINKYGVVIGDHEYESEASPLNHWSENTDPSVMAGDEWVHPYKDIGFQTAENREYFEKGVPPKGGVFMHPTRDAAYEGSIEQENEESMERNAKQQE